MKFQWFYTKEGIRAYLLAIVLAFFFLLLAGYMMMPVIPLNLVEIYIQRVWEIADLSIVYWLLIFYLNYSEIITHNADSNIISKKQLLILIVLMLLITIHPLFLLPKNDKSTQIKYYYVYVELVLIGIYIFGYTKIKQQKIP